MLLKPCCNLTLNVWIYFKIAILFSCQHFQFEVFSVHQCWMEKCASNFPFHFENRTKTNNIHKLLVAFVNFVENYLQQQCVIFQCSIICQNAFEWSFSCCYCCCCSAVPIFHFLFLFVFAQKIESVHLSHLFIYTMANISCLWNEFEFVLCRMLI